MKHRVPTALAYVALLGLAACDDDGGANEGPSATSSPTTGADTGETGSDGTTTSGVTQDFPACDDTFPTTAPNPAYPWTPNAIELVSELVAPGVFAVYDVNAPQAAPEGIPLATSGGFVIGDNGVLLVETMINRRLFCQLIDLVHAETDKPVLYAINTSYHGDHSYGNDYLPEDVQVVQHEQTAAYIAEHFDEDMAFMEANFGADQDLNEADPVAPDILVTDEGWSVDLGSQVVQAKYYGFGQTEGDLFIWLPVAHVLWTGNPLIAEQPAIPWLLDGQGQQVSHTLASVRDDLPEDAIVVPGHGRPVTVNGFDFSINYLDTMIEQVKDAVDTGLTLEQTVQSVTMEDYAGYALFGWVHPSVNVPNTYSEFQP